MNAVRAHVMYVLLTCFYSLAKAHLPLVVLNHKAHQALHRSRNILAAPQHRRVRPTLPCSQRASKRGPKPRPVVILNQSQSPRPRLELRLSHSRLRSARGYPAPTPIILPPQESMLKRTREICFAKPINSSSDPCRLTSSWRHSYRFKIPRAVVAPEASISSSTRHGVTRNRCTGRWYVLTVLFSSCRY